MRVRVTRVTGKKLRRSQKALVERQVGRSIGDYFDAAFLGGDYPRNDFTDAFATFSPGAARTARADRKLLSNAGVGRRMTAVSPRQRTAYLSVLAPNRVAAAVTARIRLVFVAEMTTGRDRRVTLTGRLLMTRKRSGGWEIFGYDVARSDVATGRGGSR